MSDSIQSFMGGGSRLDTFRYVHPKTIMTIVIAFVITMFAAVILSLVWGFSAILGMFFLAMAFVTIVLHKGKFMDYEVFLFVGLGVLFIFLSMAGVTFTTIDLSQFERFVELHQFFQGI